MKNNYVMGKNSVVIPLYNKGAYIARALTSVLNQTISCHEIVVIDDGSTDGGGEIVKTFRDPRIKLIRQLNQGVSAARNRGIVEAQGDLIAFLDADDKWESKFLEIITLLVKKYPQAGAFATAYQTVDRRGRLVRRRFPIFPPNVREGLITNYCREIRKCRWEPIWSSAVAIPKIVLKEIGGFPVGEVLGEDLDTWLRIALRYPIAWSSEIMATYYLNAMNRADGFIHYQGEPRISKTARIAIQEGLVPLDMVQDLKEYVATYQLSAIKHFILDGQYDNALRILDYAKGCKRLKSQYRWWLLRLSAIYPGMLVPLLLKPLLGLKKILNY